MFSKYFPNSIAGRVAGYEFEWGSSLPPWASRHCAKTVPLDWMGNFIPNCRDGISGKGTTACRDLSGVFCHPKPPVISSTEVSFDFTSSRQLSQPNGFRSLNCCCSSFDWWSAPTLQRAVCHVQHSSLWSGLSICCHSLCFAKGRVCFLTLSSP